MCKNTHLPGRRAGQAADDAQADAEQVEDGQGRIAPPDAHPGSAAGTMAGGGAERTFPVLWSAIQ